MYQWKNKKWFLWTTFYSTWTCRDSTSDWIWIIHDM